MTAIAMKQEFIKLKRALFDRLYHSLNEAQKAAVFTVKGPLLVLAGAGSGKTTVLVRRIAHIIRYGNAYYDESAAGSESELAIFRAALDSANDEELQQLLSAYAIAPAAPWTVLAITFTNKAAREIKTRLSSVLGDEELSKEIWSGTFHSVCVRILRRYGERAGYSSDFTIYDTDDVKKLISSTMKSLNISDKVMPVRSVMSELSRAKNALITPEEYAVTAGSDYRLVQISKIYAQYQAELHSSNALDFDDIIMQTVRILEENDDVRDYYQNKFHYVCVDEYQDTNKAQFVLTSLLAGKYRNIMVVGDDDQSIYKFRGATIENILNFDKEYSDAAVIKLEQNYRSTQTILDASNAVIRNNSGRKGKELWTSGGAGEQIVLRGLSDQNEEARFCAGIVAERVEQGLCRYRDFAVLYRMNAQANSLESAFAKSGIPYRVLGGTRFYDRKEIRDLLAYLCVINNNSDNLRLKRIINEPKRKIGESTVSAIEQLAVAENKSMFEIMRHADQYVSISKSASKLGDFVDVIDHFVTLASTLPLNELINTVTEMSGYKEMLVAQGMDGLERLGNIEELSSSALEYTKGFEDESEATLVGFLEEVALVTDVDKYDDNADAVVMMTIHSSKGLEFPVVFLPGMEEGIFPGVQSQTNEEELEEERRLAYVALTRAKKQIFISHAHQRLLFGRTQANPLSRFVEEIPSELIHREENAKPERKPYNATRARENAVRDFDRHMAFDPVGVATAEHKKTPTEKYDIGTKVRHVKFGIGEILSVKDMSGDLLYEIAFEDYGTKKLMASYAKLRREG